MELSTIKIKSLWEKLAKKIKNRAFPKTIFINDLSFKTQILALFSKNGDDTNQLEQLGFVICTKTIFNASTNNIVSDKGIITNDYFIGEVIDVNNTIITDTYIHLVKVNSGPIVINDIIVRLTMNENYHQALVNNTVGAKLFCLVLQKQLMIKQSLFNSTLINNQNFMVNINRLKITNMQILQCKTIINDLLTQSLSLEQLITMQTTNKKYAFLKHFNEQQLKIINNLEKMAIINIKKKQESCQITAIFGKDAIENFFMEAKKPIISTITALNKKIKLINQPDNIKPLPVTMVVKSYEDLLVLQKIRKKLENAFKAWRKVSQNTLENLTKNVAFGYYLEVINSLKVAHYSFNNDLLDYNLMEFKGRNLLVDVTNTILFLSNNISDNPSMIILVSSDLCLRINLKMVVNKIHKNPGTKIIYKNDMIIFSTTHYQFVTDFISQMIAIFKSDNFKHQLQLIK